MKEPIILIFTENINIVVVNIKILSICITIKIIDYGNSKEIRQ